MGQLKVEIRNGRNKTYYYRNELRKRFHLCFVRTGKYTGIWRGKVCDDKKENLEVFCRKNGLKLIIMNSKYERSRDYKKIYFDNNHGFFGKNKYFHCSYCGRVLSKKEVTVDHVIPIQKVRSSIDKKYYHLLMKRMNIENINDQKNLVASCRLCNSRKGSKAGLWIIRGLLGRYYLSWIIFYITLFLLFVFIWKKYVFVFEGVKLCF